MNNKSNEPIKEIPQFSPEMLKKVEEVFAAIKWSEDYIKNITWITQEQDGTISGIQKRELNKP